MKLYTSGTARRRAIDIECDRLQVAFLGFAAIDRVNAVDYGDNPILDLLRDVAPLSYDTVSEWLFQLARHWSLWESPRIGTFPVYVYDPSGPVDRELAAESGEDLVFHEIDDALRVDPEDTESAYRDDADDLIVHATRVLMRFDAIRTAELYDQEA